MSISIIEKVKKFADLSEGLREPLDENELTELLADIETHAERVYEYMALVENDAKELKAKSDRLATAAKEQKRKAESIKNYLKTALKANGFTRFKAGDLRMSLSTTTKLIPARPPSEYDYINHPEWIDSKFRWTRDPDLGDIDRVGDLITTDFAWNDHVLKRAAQEGDEEALSILEATHIDRLTIKVDKKG